MEKNGLQTSWVRRLYFNLLRGRFNYEKFLSMKPYYGMNIQTEALHSDTSCRNVCGFTLWFPYTNYPEITYDWNLNKFCVGEQQVKFDIFTKKVIWID